MDKVYKTFSVTNKTIDEDAGIYEAWITTESVDRDGDIVLAAGMDGTNYVKNPVVLFGHNYWSAEALVANGLDLEVTPGKGVRSKFQFVKEGISENADLVHRLWAGKYINAVSIGFMPRKREAIMSDPDPESGNSRRTGWRFDEWELLEYSIVTVPSNQDSLRAGIKALTGGDPLLEELYRKILLPNEDPGLISETDNPESESNELDISTINAIDEETREKLGEIFDDLNKTIQEFKEGLFNA